MRLATLLLAVPMLASAQASGWRDQHGKAIPDTDSMKSKSGFAASLLVTADEDWKQKWDTPSSETPSFSTAKEVPYGKRVFILLFFANPLPAPDEQVNIGCAVKITSPVGTAAFDQKEMTCFSGRIAGSLTNTYLSVPVVAFSGDPGDPPGSWVVEATMRDETRKVTLPLRYKFTLKN